MMIAASRTLTKPLGWEELKEFEFRKIFFSYAFKEGVYRQYLYNDDNIKEGVFNCRLFDLSYNYADSIGVAIVDDWKNEQLYFCKYGSRIKWSEFESKYNKLSKK